MRPVCVCRAPVVASLLLLVFVSYSLYALVLTNNAQVKEEVEVILEPSPAVPNPDLTSNEARREMTNIFFLKAHKCASSTVQNILLRFGLERDLTFVLPTVNNYIGNPHMFSADMIDQSLATPTDKYNIFAHHTRYNSEEVRLVMYDDAKYITILRHPADVYESIYSYYKFHKMFNLTFEALLKTPKNAAKINRRYMNRIGFNQMSYDLGLLEEHFNSSIKVDEFINKIDAEFELVMMSEWMEVSLVLFADVMNWPLENVISLKLNSRSPDNVYVMSDVERNRVLELNKVDYLLYSHFLKIFRRKIKQYGKQKMREDIEKLLSLNSKLQFRCVQSLNNKGFANTQAYKLRDEGDRLCYYAALGELSFTEKLRNLQRQKIKVLSQLDSLLNEDEEYK